MIETKLDIDSNRKSAKYSTKVQYIRILWIFIQLIFRYSPRPFFGFRRFLLRLFNAKIGKKAHIYNSATIYMPWNLEVGDWSSIGEHAYIYNLGKIIIGNSATISHRAHLCAGTHDYEDKTLPLLKLPIEVKDNAWICADAFVGPGVIVGEGAVVGARAVAVKDVEPWTVVAGNPAKEIKKRKLKSR